MRIIVLAIGAMILNRMGPLDILEWVFVGLLGFIAFLGDVVAFDNALRNVPGDKVKIRNPFRKRNNVSDEQIHHE